MDSIKTDKVFIITNTSNKTKTLHDFAFENSYSIKNRILFLYHIYTDSRSFNTKFEPGQEVQCRFNNNESLDRIFNCMLNSATKSRSFIWKSGEKENEK